MGGSSHYNTKARDIGVPCVMLAAMTLLWVEQAISTHRVPAFLISLAFCFVLHFAAMTTYWKKKGKDAQWWNWALVGLFYGLSMFPFALIFGHWIGFYIRTVAMTVCTMAWSSLIEKDVLEEVGRGFLDVATLPFLLI